MRPFTTLFIAKVAFSWLAGAQTIEFFYTESLDTCSINGVSIQANEQTTHGGVCAYRQDVDRVYGCPAPDPTCWTWAQECNESGIGQTVCNRGGTVFCCNAVAGETCTTTEGQINVCISNFSSPNSGIDVQTANEVYLAALGVQNVTATSQTLDPSPFSTESPVGDPTTTSTALASSESSSVTSSMSMGSTTGSKSGSSTSDTVSATGGLVSSAAERQSNNSSTLSGGAIAGIVIGVLLLCAIVGIAFFLLGRRRTAKASGLSAPHSETIPSSYYTGSQGTNEKALLDKYGESQSTPSELESDAVGRHEMSTTETVHGTANHPSRHELP